jgi:uncharacterized membrane protein (DUF2068 family)
MTKTHAPSPPSFRGRNFGITVLVVAQYIISVIHGSLGLVLFFASPDVYSVYTIVFGVLVAVFAYGLWNGKKLGWIGTVAVSIFVIIVDSLTLLNLPSTPGIPKFAGFGEITYSVLILVYLLQAHVRANYKLVSVRT